MATWTTLQGERLVVAWMDSVHLVHCVNLLLRRNPQSPHFRVMETGVGKEAERRGLWRNYDHHKRQLPAPTRRETKVEMCVYRACYDLKKLEWWIRYQREPECVKDMPPKLVAQITKYRLERA